MISVDNLSYRYGKTVAVDNISFTVKKGEIFSFLGPNGAGKTTAINLLTTLLPMQEVRFRFPVLMLRGGLMMFAGLLVLCFRIRRLIGI